MPPHVETSGHAPAQSSRCTARSTSSRSWPPAVGRLTIGEISALTGIPLPTAHRLLRTLVDRGYMRQAPIAATPWLPARPARRARRRDGGRAPSACSGGSSTPSARPPTWPCSTATGWPTSPRCPPARDADVHRGRTPRAPALHGGGQGRPVGGPGGRRQVASRSHRAPRHTANTITDIDVFLAQLEEVRARGYALDEGEQEVGVRCLAVRLPGSAVQMGLSISGPAATHDRRPAGRGGPGPAVGRTGPGRPIG